jgi:hypothetical protein
MILCLIHNIFVTFGGHVLQQTIGHSKGVSDAPFLAGMIICSYEADFIQGHSSKPAKASPIHNTDDNIILIILRLLILLIASIISILK